MLYTNMPSSQLLDRLITYRSPHCCSIYLPTHAVTSEAKGDPIVYKNLVARAVEQLSAGGTDKREIADIEDNLASLVDDEDLWQHLSDSLCVLASADVMRTYRLPIATDTAAEVSDRFHIKPILAALADASSFLILALAEGSVRLIEVSASEAKEVKVPGLPKDMSKALGKAMPRDRAPSRRIQGGEGTKTLYTSYFRKIDHALHPVLNGRNAPLVLACVEYLAPLFKSVSSYPNILDKPLGGSPEHMSVSDLADATRELVKSETQGVAQGEALADYGRLAGTGAASDDIAAILVAAQRGQVDRLMLDMSTAVYGRAQGEDIAFAEAASADSYDLLDKAAALTTQFGGTLIAMSADDLPTSSPAAAIYRYAVQ